jgi:hypothetical protein
VADYYIYAVHYKDNDTSTYIDEVRTESVTSGAKSRWTVVADIESGKLVKTAVRQSDGKYHEGQVVNVITVNGSKYLRTDKDNTARDNLDHMPTYDK